MTPNRARDVALLMAVALVLLTALVWARLDRGVEARRAPEHIVTAH